jgi:hypothetical protein
MLDEPQLLVFAVVAVLVACVGEDGRSSVSASRPDLSGTYDLATLTPIERPPEFGDSLYLAPEVARAIEEDQRRFLEERSEPTDPSRGAPRIGGAPPVGIAEANWRFSPQGEVGSYNQFWLEQGDSVMRVDGKFRTSIVTDPPNGRRPPLSPEGRAATLAFLGARAAGDRRVAPDGLGPFDDPETRPLSERCLAAISSTVPALPAVYNNVKRIVQTDDRVMLLNEMVHDARVIRLDSEHAPPELRFYLGDSIGWWEGDTLVVDTTNFLGPWGSLELSRTTHVIERFTPTDDGNLHYSFTVEDPGRWIAPWSGDFVWRRTDSKVYEYACHEGNQAIVNVLRGARWQERAEVRERSGTVQ